MKDNSLLIAIFVSALAGIFCGWFFGESMLAIQWVGDIFLDALKMLIIPLIVAAVITGVASIGDIRNLTRVGGLTLLFYACTTAIAVFLGLVVVNIMQPGAGINELAHAGSAEFEARDPKTLIDIIQLAIKPNIIAAAANSEILPIIVFCLVFAAALTTVGNRAGAVLSFFDGLNEVMMKLVIWLMYLAPIGIFALIAAKLGSTGGGEAFVQQIASVGKYIAAVLIGLGLHFLILICILFLFTGRSLDYLLTMARALVTAFGTASSSATLPLTMECATEAGVDRRSVKSVIPLGATVNMDGTALYEAVAVMFIAQSLGIEMGMTEQIIIFLTATLAAIGAAGIPQAGLATMIIVLTAVDLPQEGIGLILAVDWFLDRFRTTVNVWGDSTGAAVIERFLPKEVRHY
ncbi:MAG: dicarboxylate/amino acid:cation symporter [Gammaproteobacteria bacterium]